MLSTVLILLIAGGSGTGIYFLMMDVQQPSAVTVDLTISTIGDSLTQGGEWMVTVGYGSYYPDCYQYYVYQYLHVRGLETQVKDLGIGGQIISQICGRFNTTVPANYIVCMAGTNDVFRANYSEPEAEVDANLSAHIIATYNATIFNTIAYQESLGKAAPVLILCSIPPLAKLNGGNIDLYDAIRSVNAAIKNYVQTLNRTNILFCDMYAAVSNQSGWMIPSICKSDGVHFNNIGDQVEGEAIAKVICDNYYHGGP